MLWSRLVVEQAAKHTCRLGVPASLIVYLSVTDRFKNDVVIELNKQMRSKDREDVGQQKGEIIAKSGWKKEKGGGWRKRERQEGEGGEKEREREREADRQTDE